ncbi:hypothetical protein HN385_04980 [archaeon]|jgi:hypothetical protein|nr:hypothetical protein [archaeon]MBT3465050.1 hypothetical protein [archaeon]MBT7193675.1 hypothetical protein [archaeon]MBT7381213.1 hypothetical protein [archaeon]MBT7508538.1 hypothetical protein [archaeon]
MKNNHVLFCFGLILILFLAGCSNNLTGEVTLETEENYIKKIEVYHFHSNNQCNVCKTIGANLDETIERYFLDEVNSGKIIYGHINVQDPTNSEITERYGATGTSLWIGVYDINGFYAENDQSIWYKLNDKEEFIDYLKNLIEKRLSGEMN